MAASYQVHALYRNVPQYRRQCYHAQFLLTHQFIENLSDRQAADAVRGNIAIKYMLSLPLTDPGFDYSILSEFRTRLITGGTEQKLLDTLIHRLRELGLLKSRIIGTENRVKLKSLVR